VGSASRPKRPYGAGVSEPDQQAQLSPVPFVVALVGFVIVAVLAFVFLRAGNEGRLVRPDRLTVVDDATIRVVASQQPDCGTVERAQVDLAEDRVFVELVVVDADGTCPGATVDIVADITLPEPVGDRSLVAGVGRLRLPCTGDRTAVTCAPAG
jgi:hypothetical protein